MLNKDQIEDAAKKAAYVAYEVLGLDCKYEVALMEDPTIIEDALLDTTQHRILLNLSLLKPFPVGSAGYDGGDPLVDENYRHLLKICYLIFHEMRHLYQKRAVEAYFINEALGGKIAPQRESSKKCKQWLEEMQTPAADNSDIEADADSFAYYLTNRYPIEIPYMVEKSRRLSAMKRKYDKIPLPVTD